MRAGWRSCPACPSFFRRDSVHLLPARWELCCDDGSTALPLWELWVRGSYLRRDEPARRRSARNDDVLRLPAARRRAAREPDLSGLRWPALSAMGTRCDAAAFASWAAARIGAVPSLRRRRAARALVATRPIASVPGGMAPPRRR